MKGDGYTDQALVRFDTDVAVKRRLEEWTALLKGKAVLWKGRRWQKEFTVGEVTCDKTYRDGKIRALIHVEGGWRDWFRSATFYPADFEDFLAGKETEAFPTKYVYKLESDEKEKETDVK